MIRFYNGKVLSFGGGLKITEDEVWVDGSRIVYVGPARADLPAFQRHRLPGGHVAHGPQGRGVHWRAL